MGIRSDSRHLYLQVIDKIKSDIKDGRYKQRDQLPSEYQLAKELGVSRATLREALRILEEENVIIRRHGVGTFVNTKPLFSSGIEQLTSVTDMIERSGKKAGTLYLTTDIIQMTEKLKETYFSGLHHDKIVKMERVRTADNEPVVFCIDQLPENIIPMEHLSKEESLFTLLETYTDIHIEYAITYIEPISFRARIYNILNCQPDQAILLLKQLHYTTDDKPVLYSQNYFRSDMFSFHVLRKRV